MMKLKKRMAKWGVAAARAGVAAAILAGSAASGHAGEFDGFDGLDFGSIVQRGLKRSSFVWFGVGKPLTESAAPTTGDYRTPTQKASDQVLLAEGLKAEYVTRYAANAADMFAFWPSDESPTHLMFCIEGSRQDRGTFLPGGLVKKFNPSVQSIKLSDGSVQTILRGMTARDGMRRTPWGTLLAAEETSSGGAYEIINPLQQVNHTMDRTLGTIVDQNGLPSLAIVKRTALPTMAWEGLAVLPSGVVIAGDELRPGTGTPDADGGALFKFIPAVPRTSTTLISSLAESPLAAGNVYALRMSCTTGVQYGQGCEIGSGAWISVAAATARADADKLGATGYYRPEDLELDEEFQGEGARFC